VLNGITAAKDGHVNVDKLTEKYLILAQASLNNACGQVLYCNTKKKIALATDMQFNNAAASTEFWIPEHTPAELAPLDNHVGDLAVACCGPTQLPVTSMIGKPQYIVFTDAHAVNLNRKVMRLANGAEKRYGARITPGEVVSIPNVSAKGAPTLKFEAVNANFDVLPIVAPVLCTWIWDPT